MYPLPMAAEEDLAALGGRTAELIFELVSELPKSDVEPAQDPEKKAKELTHSAALKAAAISAGLSLPSGPLALMTILPDIMVQWRIQRQLVADIAAAYGKDLTQQSLISSLFKHIAKRAIAAFRVNVRFRVPTKEQWLAMLKVLTGKIAVRVIHRMLKKAILRWIPFAGAIGMAAVAYAEIGAVGQAAMDEFGGSTPVAEAEPQPASKPRVRAKIRAPKRKAPRKKSRNKRRHVR